jgi:hypothetical protein
VLDRHGVLQSVLRPASPVAADGPQSPTAITAVGEAGAVVTDGHAGRLFALTRSPAGWTSAEWASNQSTPRTGPLRFPRGIVADGDTLFIADTGNNRVVAWDLLQDRPAGERRVGGWPRSLATFEDGLLIAEGLGRRIVRLGRIKEPGATAADVFAPGPAQPITVRGEQDRPIAFADPHHVEDAGDGQFWLVDSDLNDVLLVDRAGRVRARWLGSPVGREFPLHDPHQALSLGPGGDAVVVDTNNGRILQVDRALTKAVPLTDSLTRPRHITAVAGGWLLSDHSSRLTLFDHGWAPCGSFVIRADGEQRHVYLDDPPRCLTAHGGFVYVPDWQRGVIYRIPGSTLDQR